MDGFLGKESFPGPATGRTSATSFAGQACFNGCIAFCNWPNDAVAAVLPPDLELAGNTSATPELHPVVFIFGEQTEGATIFGGLTFPIGVNYHEFALAIPFIKHRRGHRLHTFVPRMYSSFSPATWAGNTHYGLAKAMATMQWQGPLFLIAAPHGTLLFHASVEPTGEWAPAAACGLPNFAAMRAVFAMPVLGRRGDGTYVSSYFGWDFSAAEVRQAQAWVSIDAALAAGVTPGWHAALPSATFDVRHMIWRLSWPGSCRF